MNRIENLLFRTHYLNINKTWHWLYKNPNISFNIHLILNKKYLFVIAEQFFLQEYSDFVIGVVSVPWSSEVLKKVQSVFQALFTHSILWIVIEFAPFGLSLFFVIIWSCIIVSTCLQVFFIMIHIFFAYCCSSSRFWITDILAFFLIKKWKYAIN